MSGATAKLDAGTRPGSGQTGRPIHSPVVSAATPALRPRTGYVPRLEAFRGYGCLMVAMIHVAHHTRWNPHETLVAAPDQNSIFGRLAFTLYSIVFNGYAALMMFFVLSGFVLCLAIERGPRELAPAALRFFSARLLRIYPPIILNIALFYFIFLSTGRMLPSPGPNDFEWPSLLRHALLLDIRINGAMWTLQLELLAVPLIFAGYLAQRRFGAWPLVGVAVLLIAASFFRSWNRALGPGMAPLTPMYTFVLGLLIPTLGRALVEKLDRRHVRLLMRLSAVVFFAVGPLSGSYWAPSVLLIESVTGSILVAGIAYRGELALFRPLDWKVAHFYGRISYSFYLVHPVSLIVLWNMPNAVAELLQAGVPSVFIAFVAGLASLVAVTPLAYLCYRLAEAPFIRLIRRLDRVELRDGSCQTAAIRVRK